MGCPPAVALMQYGASAVPVLLDALSAAPATEAWWPLKLADLLGQLGDPRALPLLHAWLGDAQLPRRVRAAIALGRLARPESAAPLQRALDALPAAGDPAFEAALLYALDRVTGVAPARQARLRALLPGSEAGLAAVPILTLDLLVEVAGLWRVPAALPALRIAARHRSRFVRLGAIAALGALADTGGIPVLMARLEDELPSARRAAIAALQQITGDLRRTTPGEWLAWCAARRCRPTEAPVTPGSR
jgi:HEAT repeat protein